ERIFQRAEDHLCRRIVANSTLGDCSSIPTVGRTGTIRAIGRFRSGTVTSAPCSTARKCSDSRSLSSAILTDFMATSSHEVEGRSSRGSWPQARIARTGLVRAAFKAGKKPPSTHPRGVKRGKEAAEHPHDGAGQDRAQQDQRRRLKREGDLVAGAIIGGGEAG